jgi:hypothetical protein
MADDQQGARGTEPRPPDDPHPRPDVHHLSRHVDQHRHSTLVENEREAVEGPFGIPAFYPVGRLHFRDLQVDVVDGGRIIDGRKVVLTPSRAALHEHEHRAEQDGANRRHDP